MGRFLYCEDLRRSPLSNVVAISSATAPYRYQRLSASSPLERLARVRTDRIDL